MRDKQNMALGLFVLLFILVLSFSSEASTEKCVEITPGVYKCMDSEGNTRTLIVM